MKTIGSQKRESLFESGFRLISRQRDGSVILKDRETGTCEMWTPNDHYAGYVIEIDKVGYEFVRRV